MPLSFSDLERPPEPPGCPLKIMDHLVDATAPQPPHSLDPVTPNPQPPAIPDGYPSPTPDVADDLISGVTNRAELIERIKAGETPTWVPNNRRSPDCRYYPNHTPSSPPTLTDQHPDRPRSALHQGIFTSETRNPPSTLPRAAAASSFPLATSPPRPPPLNTRIHSRAPSLSSSFVFKTPTSPLVHSSNPDPDSDESPPRTGPIDISFASRSSRRKSLPPSVLSSLQFSPSYRRALSDQWPESPSPRRRLSGFGTDLPPGSFVGSYEESILNGRMSTTPSKPLNFLAQIGVLGLGKCKQSLRCPTHVTLPFPAYFYSVGDYDSPSPYVGQIDLSGSLSKKLGGSYRIPQRGQLQIVIKNPNKTAVKLFLVQYDLRDMEPGTKTFIRQKSFSGDGGKDSLRYLIHLHICCPSRGRYYLFKTIRVVFANRVPDGKERLRNEVLWPDPKYSAWKPEVAVTADAAVGRRRATSLHGIAAARTGTPPPPLLLDIKFPVPAVENGYGKMDLSSGPRVGGHGLLARKLKRLDVEGEENGDGIL